MNLTYQKYLFTIEAKDQLILPYYKGSTFRGAFGSAFRRIVCALRSQECAQCMLKTSCIYSYVFETSPHVNTTIMSMHSYTRIPHPFVIEPPLESDRVYNEGDMLSFGLVLIGKAVDYLPYFVFTFDEMGKTGIGRKRGKYHLLSVTTDDGKQVYTCEDRTIHAVSHKIINIPQDFIFSDNGHASLTITFITPTRISFGRRLTSNPDFHILIRSLLRRIALLSYFHGNKQEMAWDHKHAITVAESVSIQSNHTRWWDWERYSSKQRERMRMGGFVGEVVYEGEIRPYLPLLRAGEVFHAGKGTSFGLGKYETHSFSTLPAI